MIFILFFFTCNGSLVFILLMIWLFFPLLLFDDNVNIDGDFHLLGSVGFVYPFF